MADGLKAALLPNRGVILVKGEDARGFLDGIVTNALAPVQPGLAVHAALLTPQGKIIADFFITEADAEDGGGLHLDVPLINAAEVAKRLGFYKLRAKVDISDLSADLGVVALWGGAADLTRLGVAFADPRLPAMGCRAIVHRSQTEALAAESGAALEASDAYHAHRVAHALAEPGLDYLPGEAFPHEINMDQLHGVDFRKGCYIGQEVVSRMQHRGTARTRAVQLAFEGGVTVSEGAPVTAGDKMLGEVGSGAAGRAVAIIRLDRAADAVAAGAPIMAGGVEAKVLKPAWWTADWPVADQQPAKGIPG
jgi:tRNA-modifying protein YgfZ